MSNIIIPKSNSEWLKTRGSFITGTDIAPILNYESFKTKEDVISSKKGKGGDSNTSDNFLMSLGRKFEDKLSSIYPEWIKNPFYIKGCFMATCDFVDEQEKNLIEVKTTIGEKRFEELKNVPDSYLLQIMHQYICSGGKFDNVYLMIFLIDKQGMKKNRHIIKISNLPKEWNEEHNKKLLDFYMFYMK